MNSIAHESPIVREIVKRIIEKTEIKNYKTKERHRIDTNIIPRISEKTSNKIQENFTESILKPESRIEKPAPINPQPTPKQIPIHVNAIPLIPRIVPQINQSAQGYGKLFVLIHDPGVAYIECYSPNTPLVVIKNEQKQTTNISLSEQEIKNFFQYASEKSNIPLTSGVFKVVFDGMLLNAIISETIGTKFIIKKNISSQELNYA